MKLKIDLSAPISPQFETYAKSQQEHARKTIDIELVFEEEISDSFIATTAANLKQVFISLSQFPRIRTLILGWDVEKAAYITNFSASFAALPANIHCLDVSNIANQEFIFSETGREIVSSLRDTHVRSIKCFHNIYKPIKLSLWKELFQNTLLTELILGNNRIALTPPAPLFIPIEGRPIPDSDVIDLVALESGEETSATNTSSDPLDEDNLDDELPYICKDLPSKTKHTTHTASTILSFMQSSKPLTLSTTSLRLPTSSVAPASGSTSPLAIPSGLPPLITHSPAPILATGSLSSVPTLSSTTTPTTSVPPTPSMSSPGLRSPGFWPRAHAPSAIKSIDIINLNNVGSDSDNESDSESSLKIK